MHISEYIYDSVKEYKENSCFENLGQARKYINRLWKKFGYFHYYIVPLKRNSSQLGYGIIQMRANNSTKLLKTDTVKKYSE